MVKFVEMLSPLDRLNLEMVLMALDMGRFCVCTFIFHLCLHRHLVAPPQSVEFQAANQYGGLHLFEMT